MPLIVAAASALLRRSPWLTCRGLIGFRKQAASEDQIPIDRSLPDAVGWERARQLEFSSLNELLAGTSGFASRLGLKARVRPEFEGESTFA